MSVCRSPELRVLGSAVSDWSARMKIDRFGQSLAVVALVFFGALRVKIRDAPCKYADLHATTGQIAG